jgi:predicted amidophosphoribosyltransferase
LQQRLLRSFWKEQGFDEAKLEEAPARQPGSAAYCPRCSAQFRDAATLCQDCGGVALKPF